MARPVDPNKRTQILEAARCVFQKEGFAGTRMTEIAKSAGIASGTLYLYFDSKEAIAQALGDDYLERLSQALVPSLEEPDAARAIADSVHAALSFSAEEREQLRLLGLSLSLGKGCERTPGQLKLHEMLAEVLEARMAQGQIRRYDPQVLAELIGGLLEWVSQQILIHGESELERYEATLVQMLQRALVRTKGKE